MVRSCFHMTTIPAPCLMLVFNVASACLFLLGCWAAGPRAILLLRITPQHQVVRTICGISHVPLLLPKQCTVCTLQRTSGDSMFV